MSWVLKEFISSGFVASCINRSFVFPPSPLFPLMDPLYSPAQILVQYPVLDWEPWNLILKLCLSIGPMRRRRNRLSHNP
jgi:hypothetical protein